MRAEHTVVAKRIGRWVGPAVLATGAALAARFLIDPWVGDNLPYLTFFPAVAFAGYFGSLSSGVLAAVLGGLFADFFFVAPRHTFFLATTGDWLGLAGYLVGSAAICLLIHSRTQAWRKAADVAGTRERFAGIVESAMDAIIAVDQGQHIRAFNRAAEQIFGWPAGEALGQPLARFIPERFRQAHRAHVQEFGRTGVTTRSMSRPGTLWGLRRSGEEFPIEATISQIGGEGEKLFTVILRDVSDRHHAERALRERSQELEASQERLRMAQRAAAMGTWEWNIRTGDVVWSDEVCLLHGIEPGSFDGRFESWLRTVHPDDRDRATAVVREAIARGGSYANEYRTLLPDGHIAWTSARGQFFADESGKPARLVGVCMDVTERKRSEEALRHAEKMMASARVAATLAHEINNPLAAITNLAYILRTHPALPADLARYTHLLDEELQRVSLIVRQTLNLYREEGKPPAAVRMAEVVDHVLAIYGERLRGIAVEKRCQPGCVVEANPGELHQLVTNLVLNAAEAIPDSSGAIKIRVRSSRDWREPERTGLRIVIADNGVGMDAATCRRMFDPFFTTKTRKGTGLGLSVVQWVAAKHNGKIRVRSSARPGRSGTCISVFLDGGGRRAPAPLAARKTLAS